jgi:hypothetical protein
MLPDVDDAAQASLGDPLDGDEEAAIAALVDGHLPASERIMRWDSQSLLADIEHLFIRMGVLIIAWKCDKNLQIKDLTNSGIRSKIIEDSP